MGGAFLGSVEAEQHAEHLLHSVELLLHLGHGLLILCSDLFQRGGLAFFLGGERCGLAFLLGGEELL